MQRRIGPLLLLLLALSTAFAWVRWSAMPDFAWGSGLFGHLNQSKQIRRAWEERRLPDFVFDSPQTRELITFLKKSGRPVEEWRSLAGPRAHHYIERADHVANEYSPATGFALSLLPNGRSISWLVRLTLLALFLLGANAVALRAIAPSSPQKARGALIAALWPALAAFQAIQLLAISKLEDPSSYAVILPTFAAALFCALAWSRDNRGRDSRWAAFASGAACGVAAFVRIPSALLIPGFLALLKRRDWFWFLAGGYFFGFLPLVLYQANAAGAWWATTSRSLDTVTPSFQTIQFIVPLLAFASYFALRDWKRWKRLGLAVLLLWGLPALYDGNPAHVAAVGLLGWGIFFEYEEVVTVIRIAQGVLMTWQKLIFRFAPALVMLAFSLPWAWAFASGSRVSLKPPFDESEFKAQRIPAELLRNDSWIWSDATSGAFWYYGDKPAFDIASGGSPELRQQVFAWAAARGGNQYLILDGAGSELVASELENAGAKLEPRGEVFGQKYFRVALARQQPGEAAKLKGTACTPVAKLESSKEHPGFLRIGDNARSSKAIDFSAGYRKGVAVFTWSNICSDGSYHLMLTPDQAVLYTGHNNPNPSYVLWYGDVSESSLKKALTYSGKKNRTFECKSGDCWFKAPFKERLQLKYEKFQKLSEQNESSEAPEDDCKDADAILSKNLGKLFSLLGIPKIPRNFDQAMWIREEGVTQLAGANWCP